MAGHALCFIGADFESIFLSSVQAILSDIDSLRDPERINSPILLVACFVFFVVSKVIYNNCAGNEFWPTKGRNEIRQTQLLGIYEVR